MNGTRLALLMSVVCKVTWRYISHPPAYRQLELLITECRHKIKELTKELSHHMELLQNSYSPDAFSFCRTKLDCMASSLESLMAHRRAKKAARFGDIIDHNLTDNNLNQHVNNTNASTNDILPKGTAQLLHASALATKPNLPTFIWIILLLSTCPVALIYRRDIYPFTWAYILPYSTTYQLGGGFSRHLRLFSAHAISQVLF